MSLKSLWTRRRLRKARRVRIEDTLKYLYKAGPCPLPGAYETLADHLDVSRTRAEALIAEMARHGLIRVDEDEIRLTEDGREAALHVVRAHRLFERYLADEIGEPLRELHMRAERVEHRLSSEEVEKLDAQLDYPKEDPHGDPIPDVRGERISRAERLLPDWPVGKPARIVHVEDEPHEGFLRVLEYGLRPGVVVEIKAADADRLTLFDWRGERDLPRALAAHISVTEGEWANEAPLSVLKQGEQAIVRRIDDQCRGVARRRLLDLGLTPGTRVAYAFGSMFGEPTAYWVRGTVIALRAEQTARIWVTPLSSENDGDAAL